MNKFNTNVKQKNCRFSIIAILFAVLLCASLLACATMTKQKASADPVSEARDKLQSMQPVFNEASNNLVEANNELAEAQENINYAQSRIDYCNQEIPKTQDKIKIVANNLYRNGPFSYLEVILGSQSLGELISNIQMTSIANNKFWDTLNEFKQLKQEEESQMDSLSENLRLAQEKSDAAAAAKVDIENLMASLENEINTVQQASQEETGGGGGGGGGGGPAPYLGDVVATARACIGLPYVMGAAGPNAFDCSGLVCWCYGLGGAHSWTTHTFVGCQDGWYSISPSEAVPGDVVSHDGHCGIFIGGGRMIHAPQPGETVCETSVQGGMGYYRHG